jgi:PAS domain S-box-containing protein
MPELRSGTALFCTDPYGWITEWNHEAERLTGIRAAEAEGRPCWDVLAGRGDDGATVCHPGCSTGRLAREGWPVRTAAVHVRTRAGSTRVALSTIVLRDRDEPTIVHTMHELIDTPAEGAAPWPPAGLTPRQREILLLLAEGVRAKQIASRLRLSEVTVRNHIHAILSALGVHSQLEAVSRARAAIADTEPAA